MIKIHLYDGVVIETAVGKETIDFDVVKEMMNPDNVIYKIADSSGAMYFRPTDVMFIEVM